MGEEYEGGEEGKDANQRDNMNEKQKKKWFQKTNVGLSLTNE
jgi:hypothetical protein